MDDLFGDLPPPSENTEPTKKVLAVQEKCLKRISTDSIEVQEVKRTKSEMKIYKLKSFIAERKGERDEMQDAAMLLDDCTTDYHLCNCGFKIQRASFHAVFDGHGGKRASHFAKDNLHCYIKKHFPKEPVESFDKELKRRLVTAFKEMDDEFIRQASRENPAWRDGSTASCVLTINNIFYVASIGDSKTLLVRTNEGKSSVVSLSKDHSPTLYEERQRVQNAGGFVKDGRVQGVLEVSRSFGDARLKKYVISTPDIFKSTITEKDRYLIIACDGLWKGFTVNEAVKFIDNILNDDSIDDVDVRYENACKKVANEAIRRGSSDNVTVVLIRIY